MNGSGWQLDAGFSRRTLWWVVGIAVASFVAAVLAMAFGSDLGDERARGPSTFSDSPLGHSAVQAFLELGGLDVARGRTRLMFRGRPDTPVILAEPDPTTATVRRHVEDVLERAAARSAPVILVVPKWEIVDGATARANAEATQTLIDVVGDVTVRRSPFSQEPMVLPCSTSWGEPLEVELVAPQTIEIAGAFEPVVQSSAGVLVGRRGGLYVVSDPDLLNNHGLARRDNAVVIDRLVAGELAARGVVFDELVHGHGLTRSFLAELMHFPLVVLVLHGVLVVGLVLLAGRVRFGKPRLAPSRLAPGKTGLIDNTSKLLSFRGRIPDSAARYLEETLLGVARHYHLPRELPRERLVERLQAISWSRGLTMDLVTVQASVATLDRRGGDVGRRSVELACELHRWREEMTDGH